MAATNYRQLAARDAQKYGLGAWFLRQIQQESGFDPNAHSSAGAEGIAQFEPATARSYGLTDPYDPVASLDAAARMDAGNVKKYGSVAAALSAYNSGSPTAYKDPGFAGGQTFNYVRDILGGTTPDATAAAPTADAVGAGATPPRPLTPAAPAQRDFEPTLLNALGGASSSGNYTGFYRTLGNALKQRTQTPAPGMTVTPETGAAPALPTPTPGAPVGKVVGATHGEQTSFLTDLARLAGFEHAPVDINSGYRSMAEQQQLWNNRASNPNPVAAPGTSLHEQGLAADGTIGGKPLGTLPAAILRRFGLASVPGDSVHVQVAR